MRGIFRSGSGHGRFRRTVLVIVESGMIYCVVLVGRFPARTDTNQTFLSPLFQQLIIVVLISAGNDYGVIVVIDILAHLTVCIMQPLSSVKC